MKINRYNDRPRQKDIQIEGRTKSHKQNDRRMNAKETGLYIFKNLRTIFGRSGWKNENLKGKFFHPFAYFSPKCYLFSHKNDACIPVSKNKKVYTTVK